MSPATAFLYKSNAKSSEDDDDASTVLKLKGVLGMGVHFKRALSDMGRPKQTDKENQY